MAEYLLGKEVANRLQGEIKESVEELKKRGITPKLATVRLGERADDISYEKGVSKRCQSLEIAHESIVLDREIKQELLQEKIKELNQDRTLHGILLFRPLPKHLDEEKIVGLLSPLKDIDGITRTSMASLFAGEGEGFAPCTPEACIRILDHYEIPCRGKNVVIVGRSPVVGKPLSMLMLARDATVTVCHSKTENLSEITKGADIVIVAIGKARSLGEEFFSPNQIVLDVGIHMTEEGKLCGDVITEAVEKKVAFITPVPGGVGAVTTSMLLYHLILACKEAD